MTPSFAQFFLKRLSALSKDSLSLTYTSGKSVPSLQATLSALRDLLKPSLKNKTPNKAELQPYLDIIDAILPSVKKILVSLVKSASAADEHAWQKSSGLNQSCVNKIFLSFNLMFRISISFLSYYLFHNV